MNFTYKLTHNPDQVIRSDNIRIISANKSDWQLYQQWLAEGNTPIAADPLPPQVMPPELRPDPKGFYEKLIGMRGDTYPLHLVYKSITTQALDDTKDTSSLGYAVLLYSNALNINDWSLPESKEAYLSAYTILKRFLTVGQISIIDAENINFRLI